MIRDGKHTTHIHPSKMVMTWGWWHFVYPVMIFCRLLFVIWLVWGLESRATLIKHWRPAKVLVQVRWWCCLWLYPGRDMTLAAVHNLACALASPEDELGNSWQEACEIRIYHFALVSTAESCGIHLPAKNCWVIASISITFGDGSSGAWLRPRELSVCIGLQQIGDRLQGNRCVFTMPSQKLLVFSSESETDSFESSWIILNLFSIFSIRLMTMTHVITMKQAPPAVPVLNSSSWRNP